MTAVNSSKRKAVTAVTAVVAAAAIALTGTFAWQSISQTARNETAGAVNPGGRLHDDFSFTSTVQNKDVYVENFSDPADGGEAIFARVRLDEYMEVGMEAGENLDDPGRKATSLVEGADINDKTTWKTHIPGDTVAASADDDVFHDYWTWSFGGQTIYMPTFNRNKDSLAADINGTYEGTDASDDVHYDDYHAYTVDETKTADAVYDADDNTVDEGDDAVEGTNITTVEETHTAASTINGSVMTMAEWKAAGSNPGAYWVYDTDGWAYWAQPIEPGTATGLLLDNIELTNHPGQNWYYSINVVAQFVTVDDWGADDNTGFYDLTKGTAPTDDALELLSKASGLENTVTVSAANGATEVFKGDSLQFSAEMTVLGETAASQGVDSWSVSGNTSEGTAINSAGLLTVGADETATELTVTAVSYANKTFSGSMTVTVRDLAAEINAITPGSTDTITIDDIEWYVLVNQDNQALLLSKDILEPRQFDASSPQWATSAVREYLNGEWLSAQTTLSAHAVETTINTRSTYDGGEEDFTETKDKVFLLSEADVYGTFNGGTAIAKDYTLGVEGVILPENMRIATESGTAVWYWLRSPKSAIYNVSTVNQQGVNINPQAWDSRCGIRPALWVDLSK